MSKNLKKILAVMLSLMMVFGMTAVAFAETGDDDNNVILLGEEDESTSAAEEATEAEETSAEVTEAEETSAEATEAEETSADATEAEETSADATEAEETSADATEAEETSEEATEAEETSEEATEAEETGYTCPSFVSNVVCGGALTLKEGTENTYVCATCGVEFVLLKCACEDVCANGCIEEAFIRASVLNTEDFTYDCGCGDLGAIKKGFPLTDGERPRAADARMALRISAGLVLLDTAGIKMFIASDLNCDGKVTAAEARTILRVSARLQEFATVEPTTADVSTEDTTAEVTTDEVTTDEITTEVTTDEVTTDEVTTDEVTSEEVTSEEATSSAAEIIAAAILADLADVDAADVRAYLSDVVAALAVNANGAFNDILAYLNDFIGTIGDTDVNNFKGMVPAIVEALVNALAADDEEAVAELVEMIEEGADAPAVLAAVVPMLLDDDFLAGAINTLNDLGIKGAIIDALTSILDEEDLANALVELLAGFGLEVEDADAIEALVVLFIDNLISDELAESIDAEIRAWVDAKFTVGNETFFDDIRNDIINALLGTVAEEPTTEEETTEEATSEEPTTEEATSSAAEIIVAALVGDLSDVDAAGVKAYLNGVIDNLAASAEGSFADLLNYLKSVVATIGDTDVANVKAMIPAVANALINALAAENEENVDAILALVQEGKTTSEILAAAVPMFLPKDFVMGAIETLHTLGIKDAIIDAFTSITDEDDLTNGLIELLAGFGLTIEDKAQLDAIVTAFINGIITEDIATAIDAEIDAWYTAKVTPGNTTLYADILADIVAFFSA